MIRGPIWFLSAVAALVVAAAAPAGAQEPPCLTLQAADGHEPVCNPHEAQPWAMGHRNSYRQASAPVAGPRPDEPVRVQHVGPAEVPFGLYVLQSFSDPYPDGKRVFWISALTGTDDPSVVKGDPDTGMVIDTFQHSTDEGQPPSRTAILSVLYTLLDRDNHFIRPRVNRIEVFGDANPGDRLSPIKLLHTFALPARALCGSKDQLVGMALTYDGNVAFVTQRGMVGIVPRYLDRMDGEHLVVTSINTPEQCERADDSQAELETVSNSLVVDEDGGIYPLTDKAQYRFDLREATLERTWRAPYKAGTASSSRVDAGSGSTPTLMGTDPKDDRFVVINDGQNLMHLVLIWRDEIPADWEGLPGRPRRIACEHPITFGDPNRTASTSEQSVTVRGYASLIPNNELRNFEAFNTALAHTRGLGNLPAGPLLAGVVGQYPQHAPRGFERIDWDPGTRTCRSVWANPHVSVPNAIPSMSSGSNMVYAVGVREGVWGLEGMDFDTGESRLWLPVGSSPSMNPFYSQTAIAADGSMWSGGPGTYTVFRPPPRPALPRTCKEFWTPRSAVGSVTIGERRLRITGSASDRGCGGVRRVEVSVARHVGARCRFLLPRGGLSGARSCRRPVYLSTKGSKRWTLTQGAELQRGSYAVSTRAHDAAGNVEVPARPVRHRAPSR